MMQSILQDIRYALRLLAKNSGFAAVAILTLALGIGANTAIFSVVNATMLAPLPFPTRDRLAMIWEHNYKGGRERNVVNPGNFLRWRERSRLFENMGLIAKSDINVTGTGEPERVTAAMVSPSIFPMTGIQPIVGRTFLPEEEKPANGNVALLSESYWRSHFGGDPGIVNKIISLDSEKYQIVGVIPESAQFAVWGGLIENAAPIWVPFVITDRHRDAGGRFAQVLGELRPGVTIAQADAEMKAIAKGIETERPQRNAGWTTKVETLREYMVGDLRPALIVFLVGVGLVLLIAVVNVANLLLVRAASREREVAVRFAIGITRGRLVRQLLTETVMLAVGGAVVGLVLAYWGLKVLVAMAPAQLPAVAAVSIDRRVMLFSIVITLMAAVLFGMLPAFRLSNVSLNQSLKNESHSSPSKGRSRVRQLLAGGEAALALVLLVGAGLVVRSFINLLHVDTGYNTENLLSMRLSLPETKYKEPQWQAAFFEQLVDRVKSLPGVKSAAATSYMPLTSLGAATHFLLDNAAPPPPGDEPTAHVRSVTADYFRTMSMPLLAGRAFEPSQDKAEDAVKKIVVNETLVDKYWPGQNPLGKRITMEWNGNLHAEVVGVVKDVKLVSLEDPPRPQMYWYAPQFPYSGMALVVKSEGDPAALVSAIRAQAAAIDPEIPIDKVQTAKQIISGATQGRRFTMSLMGAFAALALLLAAIGLYGVVSYSVAQRTHEIGIRMALGARVTDVLMMVLREGLLVTAGGVAVGVLASLAFVQLVQKLLFGVGARDAATFAAVAFVLLGVGALASFIPARRASKVDPMIALRYE